MSPRYAKHDLVHRPIVDLEAFRYGALRNSSHGVQCAYLKNLILGQLVLGVQFSRLWDWLLPPSFRNRILHVIMRGPKKKMPSVTARRMIAPVKHVQRKIKISVKQHKGDTVSHPVLFPESKAPVFVAKPCHPWPAIVRAAFIHSFPESLFDHFRVFEPIQPSLKSFSTPKFTGSNLFHRLVFGPLALRTRRALLFSQTVVGRQLV